MFAVRDQIRTFQLVCRLNFIFLIRSHWNFLDCYGLLWLALDSIGFHWIPFLKSILHPFISTIGALYLTLPGDPSIHPYQSKPTDSTTVIHPSELLVRKLALDCGHFGIVWLYCARCRKQLCGDDFAGFSFGKN